MISRRRFLTIAAASLAAPVQAAAVEEWRGTAMGSAARIVLSGATAAKAARVFRKAEAVLRRIERQFSLHRDSDLTRLNRNGWLSHPTEQMRAVCDLADQVHAATGGAFDPTVQPLWLATATGGDTAEAFRLIGWPRVRRSKAEIRLEPRMQLTFNGIAQGYAADCVADLMRDEGFADVLIDMGEIAALGQRPAGGGWRADIATHDGALIAHATLSDRALATSSPGGTLIGRGLPHILDPNGGSPIWSVASVSAPRAALADALSTAFCLMDRKAIEAALIRFPDARLEALA
jgi:thiamine biosynthesis lipoprotein